jgi:adenylate cyclase
MTDRTFAFVDLSGFTALTEAHGDEEAVATLGAFRRLVTGALGPSDVLVKTIGDAAMLAFEEPAGAVAALRRVFDAAADDASMPLIRAGAHHGAAVEDAGDFFGAAVNLAARVAAHAAGGQVLATTEVARAATTAGEVVTHVGCVRLRNIAEPVDLYEIDLDPGTEIAVDPVCAMRVPTGGPSRILLQYGDRDVYFCGLPCAARYAAAPERYS